MATGSTPQSSTGHERIPPTDPNFPCSITIHIPFPTPRLAGIALRSLSVDKELSPLVRRSLSLVHPDASASASHSNNSNDHNNNGSNDDIDSRTVLESVYKATTDRMLRVAVNGFFESLGVVLAAMRELDDDIVGDAWVGDVAVVSTSESGSEAAGLGPEDVDQDQDAELRQLRRVQGIEERGVVG